MLYIHSIQKKKKGLVKEVIKTPNCHDIHAHVLDLFGYIKLYNQLYFKVKSEANETQSIASFCILKLKIHLTGNNVI